MANSASTDPFEIPPAAGDTSTAKHAWEVSDRGQGYGRAPGPKQDWDAGGPAVPSGSNPKQITGVEGKVNQGGAGQFQDYFKSIKISKPMSNEEIEHHKTIALQMGQDKVPLAQIKAYLDAAGVPMKRGKVGYAPGTEEHLGGLLMSALHGATFGWDDEAVGSLYGLVTGSTAQAGRDVYRARLQAFHDANPLTDFAAQMAGGALTGGAVAGVTKKAIGMAAPKAIEWMSNLGVVNKTLAASGLGGAAYAAGDAEGDPMARLAALPGGAATGMAFGAGAVGLGAVAGAIAKPVLRNIPIIKKIYHSVEEQRDMTLLHDLQADGVTPGELLLKADALHQQGLTPTIADLAGENTMNRMAATQAASGKGMQTIKTGFKERQMGAVDRVMDWFQGNAKLSLQNIEQVRNGLLGVRRLDGDMLYKDALFALDPATGVATPRMVPMTDKLSSLFRNKYFREAWNEARLELREQPGGQDIGALSANFFPPNVSPGYKAGNPMVSPKGKKWTVPIQQGAPQEVLPTELSLAGLDYTKRYLDRIVRSGFQENAGGWKKGIATGIAQNLEGALSEIDHLVPQYGKARGVYHSDSRVIDALDNGRQFLSKSADKIALEMSDHLSTSEAEAYKLGTIEDLRDLMYNKRGKAPDIATMLYNREMTRKLKAVWGKDADDLLDHLRSEARFAESYGKTMGSRTPQMLGMMADNEASAAAVAGNILAQRPGGVAIVLAKAAGARMRLTHGEQLANSLAEAYTTGLDDPQQLTGMLLNLASRKPRPSRAPLIGAVLGGQANAQPYRP